VRCIDFIASIIDQCYRILLLMKFFWNVNIDSRTCKTLKCYWQLKETGNFGTNMATILGPDASNINFSLLLTKFLQLLNLAIFTTLSLFNLLAVGLPALHLLSLSLARQPAPAWKSKIAHLDMYHPSLESTSRFIPSASPFLSRFTSSSTYQLIYVIIPTLVIHHSFTLSLQAQNLPFQ